MAHPSSPPCHRKLQVLAALTASYQQQAPLKILISALWVKTPQEIHVLYDLSPDSFCHIAIEAMIRRPMGTTDSSSERHQLKIRLTLLGSTEKMRSDLQFLGRAWDNVRRRHAATLPITTVIDSKTPLEIRYRSRVKLTE